MKKIIGMDDVICKPEGIVTVCGWEPGAIGGLLAMGLSLRDAMASAKRAGALQCVQKMHNLTVSVGKQYMGKFLAGTESTGLRYLAIGTGTTTPALADTQLVSESYRQLLTECTQERMYVYSSAFLLASACSFYIKEGALFGGAEAGAAANSGYMLCRFLLDHNNTTAKQDLTFQHTGIIG